MILACAALFVALSWLWPDGACSRRRRRSWVGVWAGVLAASLRAGRRLAVVSATAHLSSRDRRWSGLWALGAVALVFVLVRTPCGRVPCPRHWRGTRALGDDGPM
jgi:hypothetical protein